MPAWVTYSKLLKVSVGIALTGSLWYMAPERKAIRGEHIAACLASAMERRAFGCSLGTNDLTKSSYTGVLHASSMSLDIIYTKTLVSLLNTALGYDRGPNTSIFWLDAGEPLPLAGDYIVDVDPIPALEVASATTNETSGSVVKDWSLPRPEKYVETLLTTETYVPPANPAEDALDFMYINLPVPNGSLSPNAYGANPRMPADMSRRVLTFDVETAGDPPYFGVSYNVSGVTNLPVVPAVLPATLFYTNVVLSDSLSSNFTNWWAKLGLSPVLYKLGCETLVYTNSDKYTKGEVHVSPLITVTNLNEAKAMASSLQRTVCILSPGDLSYTSWKTYIIDKGTNRVVHGDEDEEVDRPDAEDEWALAATDFTSAETEADVVSGYGGTLYYAEVETKGYYEQDKWLDFDELSHVRWDGRSSRSTYARRDVLTGCTLPYPALSAYEAGVVKSVEIFACVYALSYDANSGGNIEPSSEVPEYSYTVSGSSDTPAGSGSPPFDASFDMSIPETSAIGWDGSVAKSGYSVYNVNPSYIPSDESRVVGVRLSSVGKWSGNPEAAPEFTVSAASKSFPPAYGSFTRVEGWTNAEEGWNPAYRGDTYRHFACEYRISHFVVVVEWDWECFGTDSYSPILNTPPWMTP